MKYHFKRTPRRHQVVALKKMLRNGWGGALLMETRTGKTKVAVDWLGCLFAEKKIEQVLIICPKNVIEVWMEHFRDDFPFDYEVLVWDARNRKYLLPKPSRSGKRLLVVLTNFEAFARPGRRIRSARTGRLRRDKNSGRIRIRNEVRRWAAHNDTAMVVDEGHRIGGSGPTSSIIATLHGSAPYRLMLTGTPITKATKPQNIWYEWQWLNPDRLNDWQNAGEFKEHFGRWYTVPGVPVPMWKAARNFEELKELMDMDSFSVARDDCLDLPESDEEIISVKLTSSARAYDAMAEHMIAEVYDYRDQLAENRERRLKGLKPHVVEAPIALVKILRLAQISSGFSKNDQGELVQIGREKLDLCLPILWKAIDSGDKIVLASRFKNDLDLVHAAAQKRYGKYFRIHSIRGGMDRLQIAKEIRIAKDYIGPILYLIQPRAGSLGIDLSFCNRMVWFSLTPSFVDFRQCCDRIALSKKSTVYTYLLAPGVDKLLYDVLVNEDGAVAKAVLKSPERLLRR